jgi:hypothetical protein
MASIWSQWTLPGAHEIYQHGCTLTTRWLSLQRGSGPLRRARGLSSC